MIEVGVVITSGKFRVTDRGRISSTDCVSRFGNGCLGTAIVGPRLAGLFAFSKHNTILQK